MLKRQWNCLIDNFVEFLNGKKDKPQDVSDLSGKYFAFKNNLNQVLGCYTLATDKDKW